MNRKVVFIFTIALLAVFSFGVFAQQYSYDYETMKKEEYFAELQKWQKREADAKAAIAQEESKLAQTEEQLSATQAEIENTWNEIYAMLDTDKSGYNDMVDQASALENDLNSFVGLSPEEIYSRSDELETYKNRLNELRKDKRSLGPDPYKILSRVEGLIQEAVKKGEPAAAGKYTVARGDYLWKISKMPEIYGDPYAWIRIYSANREQIGDNPDLIYPNRIFDIPRMPGRNEHWVARGESLASIAGSTGNAFSWQRIYEANKELIGEDANMIFPHMILKMPAN